ncbi:hypothetical protein D3C73_996020 [compost metagenome]
MIGHRLTLLSHCAFGQITTGLGRQRADVVFGALAFLTLATLPLFTLCLLAHTVGIGWHTNQSGQ